MAEAAWGRGRASGVSESLAFLTSRAPPAPLSSPVLWAPRTHTRLKGQNRIWGLFSSHDAVASPRPLHQAAARPRASPLISLCLDVLKSIYIQEEDGKQDASSKTCET